MEFGPSQYRRKLAENKKKIICGDKIQSKKKAFLLFICKPQIDKKKMVNIELVVH